MRCNREGTLSELTLSEPTLSEPTLSEPDALVFDLDGTLWDTSAACAIAWTAALAKCGLDHQVTEADIRSVTGRPFAECVAHLLGHLPVSNPEILGDLIEAGEAQAISAGHATLYDGVAAGLARLAGHYPLYLVSNCQGWYLASFLERSGMAHLFSGADCHGHAGLPKDEMLMALVAREDLKRPVYVGDTVLDESAARAAGMAFCHAAWGFGEASAPDAICGSFAELLSLYGRD